jgi:hypothetical protein
MTKNNAKIINFPVVKKPKKQSQKVKKQNEIINHLLQDKDGNQIFLKDYTTKKAKYLIPEGAENEKIERGDNIILPFNVDCEFTDYVGMLNKITYEQLARNDNKFKTQYLRQQSFLAHKTAQCVGYLRQINLEDVASGLIKELPIELLKELESGKSSRNQMISTQFKHCMYDDPIIFFNPKLEPLVDEYDGKNEQDYKEEFHGLD